MRVETRTTLSSFVIEGAERPDEGQYSIIVTNPAGEDRAELTVKIVGQWYSLSFSHSPLSFQSSTLSLYTPLLFPPHLPALSLFSLCVLFSRLMQYICKQKCKNNSLREIQ